VLECLGKVISNNREVNGFPDWAEDMDHTEDFPLSLYCTFFQYSLLLLGILMKVCMDDSISERCSLSTLKVV